jgi:hypothetical protein
MPILAENLARYPDNWLSEIRPAILKRARNCCEGCGVPNGIIGYRDEVGTFHGLARAGYRVDYIQRLNPDVHVFRLVLTIAHLDHVPEHSDPDNLRAFCQRCHFLHDAKHHVETARLRRRARLALRDLFDDQG